MDAKAESGFDKRKDKAADDRFIDGSHRLYDDGHGEGPGRGIEVDSSVRETIRFGTRGHEYFAVFVFFVLFSRVFGIDLAEFP